MKEVVGFVPLHSAFIGNALPALVHINEEVRVIDGDWDLSISPLTEQLNGYEGKPRKIRHNNKIIDVSTFDKRFSNSSSFPVAIGRNGDVILLDSMKTVLSRIRPAQSLLPVRTWVRHPIWALFRERLARLARNDADGILYTEPLHPDLSDFRGWNGKERWEAIRKHLLPDTKSVLDIGAHLGYMCMQLEDFGREPVAVEVDDEYCDVMKVLQRATHHRFPIIQEDIIDVLERNPGYDGVLALAVFHHFLKTRSGFEKLSKLLPLIKTREMYLWVHSPEEDQMKNAFCNFLPEEFASFVSIHCGLPQRQLIGNFNFRPLFRLSQ